MKAKILLFFTVFVLPITPLVFSSPIYSPTWGFSLDLPEGYEYTGGDGKNRFSFANAEGAEFDAVVYHTGQGATSLYTSVEALAMDVQRRLNNRGDVDSFEYRGKKAFILELSFLGAEAGSYLMEGWALCLELGIPNSEAGKSNAGAEGIPSNAPLLLAMAYGPAGIAGLELLHFSALDSIAPEEGDKLAPGPITEFAYPRINRAQEKIFGLEINALLYKEDAEAAQALVDREFQVLRRYENAPNWQEAWIRFYRAIYRDSFDRLSDIAFQVERKLNVPPRQDREFADKALQWVQSFSYERDLLGSDFQNLVTAATEGRGDCDSRAMLWAIVLKHADINSAIMVSRHYSHAMGLADLPGAGARFEVDGQKLLVAETTATVSIGLIGETVSDVEYWLGISFD